MGPLPAEEAPLGGEWGAGGRNCGGVRERQGPEPGSGHPGPGSQGPGARPGRSGIEDLTVLHPPDGYSAEDKYKIWMRHRYNDCLDSLAELMGHDAFQVKVRS